MADMLVKLYELSDHRGFLAEQEKLGITIRKPIGPDKQVVVDWAREMFSDLWGSETDVALCNRPVTCFIAVQDKELIGFSCYDATALGFFGPVGVKECCRGKGTGKALLLACLGDMKQKGYGYAIIGQTELVEFYGKAVGAVAIPDSSVSVWKTLVSKEGG